MPKPHTNQPGRGRLRALVFLVSLLSAFVTSLWLAPPAFAQEADVSVAATPSPAPPASVHVGETGSFTVLVTNSGPDAVGNAGVTVANAAPSGMANVTWTCVGTGGAVCPSATGTGNVIVSAQMPVGS